MSSNAPSSVASGPSQADGEEEEHVHLKRLIMDRYSKIWKHIKKEQNGEDIKLFVFNRGFDGDGKLGFGLNHSIIVQLLWLLPMYHDVLHIVRCGVHSGLQVERAAKRLYSNNGFFKDIEDYLEPGSILVESLPTAASVKNPQGFIGWLDKHDKLSSFYKGFVAYAILDDLAMEGKPHNSRNFDIIPDEAEDGNPMEIKYFDNEFGDLSTRDKAERLEISGDSAYRKLFARLEEQREYDEQQESEEQLESEEQPSESDQKSENAEQSVGQMFLGVTYI
jgi:hypothetical protein